MPVLQYLEKIVSRESLTVAEAESVMESILHGDVSVPQIAALLVALRMKGETADELEGFARAMRARAVPVRPEVNGEPLLDTCGTGGDGANTFNISTVAAFVVAGAGVKVAKHGNRSISSQCGSADILEALGVHISLPPDRIAQAIREIGIGFLYAPAIHPAMKYAQPARIELKLRTVFNLLGPLTNPAGANTQVVGAPSVRAAELMAQALAGLGLQRGCVVHGMDGLDEITTTDETLMLEIRSGVIAHRTVKPEDFGVDRARPSDLRTTGRDANVRIVREVLEGTAGPALDIVLINAAAGLVCAGRAADYREGVETARAAIVSGAAMGKLEKLAAFTRSEAAAQA